MLYAFLTICFFSMFLQSYSMDNGVARTPPMGWLAWERFRCVRDCKTFPNDCVGEKLFKDMADRMFEDGWKDAGYEFVNIDDCWMADKRDEEGRLYANPSQFPNGIKGLADYIHLKGLKLGIYEAVGNHTCSGFPGSHGHEETDAMTFAEWGVDSLKFDACYASDAVRARGYPMMSHYLNKTERPIVFACSWPADDGGLPPKVNYTLLGEICNLWRNYNDIGDSWDQVLNIIEWYATHQDDLNPAVGPGKWNDPDMIIAGDFALSIDQSKTQFGIWSMLAAPLLLSSDLRTIDSKIANVLKNPHVIAVDQDKLGIPGRRYSKSGSIQTWSKPLSDGDYAIAIMNTATGGFGSDVIFTLSSLNVNKASSYSLFDLYEELDCGKHLVKDEIKVLVVPNGIRMFRAVPVVKEFVERLVEVDVGVEF